MRTSAGAANHMLIASVTNINDAIRKLTDSFVNVYSADMNGKLIYDVNLKEEAYSVEIRLVYKVNANILFSRLVNNALQK